MKEISLISSELDGAKLRRVELKNPYYSRCDGKADEEYIHEAINHRILYKISDKDWQRIFGDK